VNKYKVTIKQYQSFGITITPPDIEQVVEAAGYEVDGGVLTFYKDFVATGYAIKPTDESGHLSIPIPSYFNPCISFSPGNWTKVELIKE
jgi:hypothetical protein